MHPHSPETRGQTIHWAQSYDWLTSVFGFGRPNRLDRAIVTRSGVTAGMRVLDVGCGTGRLALRMKQVVGEAGAVHGIDASPEMIERASQKAKRRGFAIDFRLGVAEQLPYEDTSFDLVVSTLVFHHLPDDLKRDSLVEIHRVLEPGGRVVIGDFVPGEGRWFPAGLGRFLGLFGHGHGHGHGRDLDHGHDHGHGHGHDHDLDHGHDHGRPLVEHMREAGFDEAYCVPSGVPNVELGVATRHGAAD